MDLVILFLTTKNFQVKNKRFIIENRLLVEITKAMFLIDFFDDDSMVGNKSVPFKYPNVGRPVSNISKPNGNLKLKPVVPKNTVPPKEVMAKKPVLTKKLAPVAISSASNPTLAVRTSKSVTGFAAKPSDIKEQSISPRGNSSESQKPQVNFPIKKILFRLEFFKLIFLMFSVPRQHHPKIWLHVAIVDAFSMKNVSQSTKVFARNKKNVKCLMGAYIVFRELTQKFM